MLSIQSRSTRIRTIQLFSQPPKTVKTTLTTPMTYDGPRKLYSSFQLLLPVHLHTQMSQTISQPCREEGPSPPSTSGQRLFSRSPPVPPANLRQVSRLGSVNHLRGRQKPHRLSVDCRGVMQPPVLAGTAAQKPHDFSSISFGKGNPAQYQRSGMTV